ncbi:MAG: lycopene cyclase family protein [Rubrobacteraceae bacterium]
MDVSSVGDGSRRADYLPSLRDGRPIVVPENLKLNPLENGYYEYVILGAGCAGLSLCRYLLEQGATEPILILDQKSEFADDRTWCFWDVEPTPFSHLANKQWGSWAIHAAGDIVEQKTERYPYQCLTAADFYRSVLEKISHHKNVTLQLGEPVESCKEHEGETFIQTTQNTYTARYVFDGRGLPPNSPMFEEARIKAVWVPQKFVGLRIRSREPVFDPERCTLMDFSVSQERGLRFVYVLPFSEREALVENVYLSEAKISVDEYRDELESYLSVVYGIFPDDYVVDGEERGYIPMTDYAFPRKFGERTYSIGMLGGESRPSTGYTFLRIQRYCRALAENVVAGREPPQRVEAARYKLLDKIFLRFMKEHPEKCPGVYRRMFTGLPADTLVRFLTEKSTLLEDLRLVLAMPKIPFVKIAVRLLARSVSSRAG